MLGFTTVKTKTCVIIRVNAQAQDEKVTALRMQTIKSELKVESCSKYLHPIRRLRFITSLLSFQ